MSDDIDQANDLKEVSGKILVVDDQPMSRHVLTAILRSQGHDVLSAEDAGSAYRAMEDYQPDLLVLDVVMPGVDGFAVAGTLKSDPRYQHVPIIMVTALEDRQSRYRGLDAGAEDFVSKPVDGRELSTRVRNLLRLKRLHDFLSLNNRILQDYDTLTGLPNRTHLESRVNQAATRVRAFGGEVSLIALYLENFKEINDALGFALGDLLLKSVAQRLRASVGPEAMVSRLSGSKFVLLVEGGRAESLHVARSLQRELLSPFRFAERDVVVVSRMGVSSCPTDGTDAESLLRHADVAVNFGSGRDAEPIPYSPEMEAQASQQLSLETDLRLAVDRGELMVYFQPQVELATGALVGAEALVRWKHPLRGMIPPTEFIPIAEKSSLIHRLGRLVLRRACAQVRDWQVLGLPEFRVSVNISARQLEQSSFEREIAEAIAETALDPKFVELEVTEGVALADLESSVDKLSAVGRLGVSSAVDDFGTGYSSLAYLRRLPVQSLKVDRSFVRDLPADQDAVSIVRAILGVAHGLGKKVIAEGVETAEQLEFLRSIDCDVAQGFHFSRPIPPDEMEQLLRAVAAGAWPRLYGLEGLKLV